MAKTIPLSKGFFATVDDDMYECLCQWRWHYKKNKHAKGGYAYRGQPHKERAMHRLVIGARPGQHVDHINGDPLDNRRANLRLCDHFQNMKNQKKQQDTVSPYKGVYWVKRSGKWAAQIESDGRHHYLGLYESQEAAAEAYDRAAGALHGEFARLNFPHRPLIPAVWSPTFTSPYRGVGFSKQSKAFRARITTPEGKRIHLGTYRDDVDAAKAYDRAALALYGQRGFLNFPAATS